MLTKNIGKLSKGCELCFEGKKLVLFVTGICPRNCVYCPLSEKKKDKDVIHANELKTKDIKKIIQEAKLSKAEGAGITGGDPLAKINRTIFCIKSLKKAFGKKFHIHLYTSLELLNEENIKKLQKAGLDELRLHPNVFNKKLWQRIQLTKGKFKEVGIEIPAIPKSEKQILELINFAKDKVNFFNLNELEYATLHEKDYKRRGWKINADYSVKGSEKTALNILKKLKNKKIRIHYCSAKFKDSIQFTERIKRRAKSVATPFDKITAEGTLMRGAVYTTPIKRANLIKNQLKRLFPKKQFEIDKKKKRIIFSVSIAKEVSKKFKNCYIVEEYPTVDALEVEKEKLS
jgi:hypothetical protein